MWKCRLKRAAVRAGLIAFGMAFETASRRSARLREELRHWEDGAVFSVGVLNGGPGVAFRFENGAVRWLGEGVREDGLAALFKSDDAAVRAILGLEGAHMAAVKRDTAVRGDVNFSVAALRAMGIVQAQLFPAIVTRRIFKRPLAADRGVRPALYARIACLLAVRLLFPKRTAAEGGES